jgi:hypothetical protein
MGVTLKAARASRHWSDNPQGQRDESRIRTSRVMPLLYRPADASDTHLPRHSAGVVRSPADRNRPVGRPWYSSTERPEIGRRAGIIESDSQYDPI